MDAADSLKKSNMLQSPFILGEGRDSLKGTEQGTWGGLGGRQAAIKTAPGFILAKNFAFPFANRRLEPGIAARPHRGRLLGGGSGRRRRREKPQRGEEKKKMAQRLSPDRRHGDFPAWNRGLKGTPEEPTGADRGPPVPPLCEEAVGGARSGRVGAPGAARWEQWGR